MKKILRNFMFLFMFTLMLQVSVTVQADSVWKALPDYAYWCTICHCYYEKVGDYYFFQQGNDYSYAATLKGTRTKIAEHPHPYSYGDCYGITDGKVLYYISKGYIRKYNMATKKSVKICAFTAANKGFTNMLPTTYNNCLYIRNYRDSANKVYRIDLKTKQISECGFQIGLLSSGECMYQGQVSDDGRYVYYQEGKYADKKMTVYVFRADLKTGKRRQIYTGTQESFVVGQSGKYMYFYVDNVIYRTEVGTTTVNKVFALEEKAGIENLVYGVKSGYVYYGTYNDRTEKRTYFRYKLSDGTKTRITVNAFNKAFPLNTTDVR